MLNSTPALHLLCSVRLAMQVSATDAHTGDCYTCRNYRDISFEHLSAGVLLGAMFNMCV